MTIDAAVFGAGNILVAVLVWQTHRLTSCRLYEIENQLDGLRELASQAFGTALSLEPAQTDSPRTDSSSDQRNQAKPEGTPAPQTDVEPELTNIELLCAKLITLAPPKAALPLIAEPKSRLRPLLEDRGPRDGRTRLRPWPNSGADRRGG
jgi:hypothetical protein